MKPTHNYDLENFDVQYIESEKEIQVFNDDHVFKYTTKGYHWTALTRKASESDQDYKKHLLSLVSESRFIGWNDRKLQNLANVLADEQQRLSDTVIFKDFSKN